MTEEDVEYCILEGLLDFMNRDNEPRDNMEVIATYEDVEKPTWERGLIVRDMKGNEFAVSIHRLPDGVTYLSEEDRIRRSEERERKYGNSVSH